MFVLVGGGSPGILRLPLIGKTPAEEMLKELVKFARNKENWFNSFEQSAEGVKSRMAKSDPRPEHGFHAKHACHFTAQLAGGGEEAYHVTFTITEAQVAKSGDLSDLHPILLRHATIGVGAFDRLPDETEAFTITRFLGFKEELLRGQRHPDFLAAVVFEPIPEEEEVALRT